VDCRRAGELTSDWAISGASEPRGERVAAGDSADGPVLGVGVATPATASAPETDGAGAGAVWRLTAIRLAAGAEAEEPSAVDAMAGACGA
jgi:hypothetical protein